MSSSVETPTELPPTLRAFIALRMDPAVDEAIAGLIEGLKRRGGDVSWVKPANFHLTLKFLGPAVPRQKIEPLKTALGSIAAMTAPFRIETRGIGAFPNLKRPRVIWAGLGGQNLIELAAEVENACAALGFGGERRPYSPHLTIGRVRGLRNWSATLRALEAAANIEFGESWIEAMAIYRSVLKPTGAVYQVLGKYGLGG